MFFTAFIKPLNSMNRLKCISPIFFMKLFVAPVAKGDTVISIVIKLWVSLFRSYMMNLNSFSRVAFPTPATVSFNNSFLKLHPSNNGTWNCWRSFLSIAFIPRRSSRSISSKYFSGFSTMGFPFKGVVICHYPTSGVFKRLFIAKTTFAAIVPVLLHLPFICFLSLMHGLFAPKTSSVVMFIHPNSNIC